MKKIRYLYYALLLGFILGVSDGYVALWEDGNSQPLRIFPYRAENLPVADQVELKKGIHLDHKTELAQLLEDYLS